MKISLPDITLIAVTSIKIPETVLALRKSSLFIDFGAVKLVSPVKPHNFPEDIQFEYSTDITCIDDYNLYVFRDLTHHVQTKFCLLIQYDSWVINPGVWDNKWLEYDYIGAPWIISPEAYICHDTGEHVRVGNGGFSLRSKKLLEIPRLHNMELLQEQGWYNEDGNICVYHRKQMLDLGIVYAPVNVAARFSYERHMPENFGVRPFGFHKNLPSEVLPC